MQVSIGRSHQPPVLCQAAWTVLLELLVCPPTRMPLRCKAILDRDISKHSIDGAFRPRGPRQGPHGATSSWPRMAGSWVNRESKTHKSKSCALCMLYIRVYFYKQRCITCGARCVRGDMGDRIILWQSIILADYQDFTHNPGHSPGFKPARIIVYNPGPCCCRNQRPPKIPPAGNVEIAHPPKNPIF